MTPEKTVVQATAVALAALTLGLTAQPGDAAGLVIDDFSTSQSELNVSPVGPHSAGSSAAGGGIAGGERDLLLTTDPGVNPFTSSAAVDGGIAQLADNSQFSSTLVFQWDGTDGDPDVLDTAGLGAIDLTAGGSNAFEIGLVFEDLPASLEMTVYSGSGASNVVFPGTGLIFTDLSVFIPYALFMGSADFTSIGAIELAISAPTNGLDIALDFVQTGVAPIPVPGAMLFFGTALVGLGLVGRRET